MNNSIIELDQIYNTLKSNNLLNEQFTLDWLDAINEISVRQ